MEDEVRTNSSLEKLKAAAAEERIVKSYGGQHGLGQPAEFDVPAPKYGQIPDRLETQERLVSRLTEAVQNLTEKLQPIIQAQAPDNDSPKCVKPPQCAIAEHIDRSNDRIEAALLTLVRLIDLVEV